MRIIDQETATTEQRGVWRSEAYTNDAHNLILSRPFVEEILIALSEAEDTKAMILHDRLRDVLDGRAKS